MKSVVSVCFDAWVAFYASLIRSKVMIIDICMADDNRQ